MGASLCLDFFAVIELWVQGKGLIAGYPLGARASCPQTALGAGGIQWRQDSPTCGRDSRRTDGEARSGQCAAVTSSPVRSLTVAVLIGRCVCLIMHVHEAPCTCTKKRVPGRMLGETALLRSYALRAGRMPALPELPTTVSGGVQPY